MGKTIINYINFLTFSFHIQHVPSQSILETATNKTMRLSQPFFYFLKKKKQIMETELFYSSFVFKFEFYVRF